MNKKIISLDELSKEDIFHVISASQDIKKHPGYYRNRLNEKTLLLLFQKTSTRTRVAFELGMKKLGGHVIVLDWEESNFSISPIKHESRYVSTVVDCILARLKKNRDLLEIAQSVDVPVINGCCDIFHPTQILADLLTIYEKKGTFNTSITYVGVHNNIANSLFYACMKIGIKLYFVTPLKNAIPEDIRFNTMKLNSFEETLDLQYALSRSEFVYTDTWINMEHFDEIEYSEEREVRIKTMLPFQVNRVLIENRDIFVMHDMPVHPGFEIDDYAITCEKSVIFQQAENRLYTAQALLLYLLDAL